MLKACIKVFQFLQSGQLKATHFDLEYFERFGNTRVNTTTSREVRQKWLHTTMSMS